MKSRWGILGSSRGQSQAVKGFSQRLINDHNMANQELAKLAKQKGVSLPGDDAENGLDADQNEKRRRL